MKKFPLSVPWFFAVLVFLIAGCQDMSDGAQVLLGNYSYQQGEFQEASLRYLGVLETGRYQDWLRYNLGNVYYALGESAAALDVWSGISSETYEEIQYRLSFNRGHLYYQKGLYQEAYVQFKKALKLRPRSMVTKQNMELTLQKIQVLSATPASTGDRPSVPALSGSGATMLEYVKQIEGTRWKSNRNVTAEENSRDW